MSTFEELLREVENSEQLTKEASNGSEGDLERLLRGITTKMEKNASQERIMKYAHSAGNEFAKGAAEKFAQAAEAFVDIVNTDEFAEKVANLILYKLAVETSDTVIHKGELSDPAPKEDPRDAVEKDQMEQDTTEPDKLNKKIKEKIEAMVNDGASSEGKSDVLTEKKASDILAELIALSELEDSLS